jgi:mRNA-degrading endonuclease RelE of RelBE toxin-antitoxin system
MKYWEKLLRRASRFDRNQVEAAIEIILARKFPPNTLPLKGIDHFRTRVGDWRIEFHHVDKIVLIDKVGRRNERTYKQ